MNVIGRRNKLVRFERKTTATDPDYGPQPTGWETVCTVWANVQDVLPSRAESVAQGLRIASRPARIRIPYREDITSAMRVVILERGERLMSLVSQPAELGFKQGLEIMAQDYSTAGDAA